MDRAWLFPGEVLELMKKGFLGDACPRHYPSDDKMVFVVPGRPNNFTSASWA